jgi:hypothetical protein
MKAGDVAQFPGVLISDRALARIISDYEAKLTTAVAEGQLQVKEAQAKAQADLATCKADAEAERSKTKAITLEGQTKTSVYEKALQNCNPVIPWWKSPYFGFIIGQMAATGIFIGAQRVR